MHIIAYMLYAFKSLCNKMHLIVDKVDHSCSLPRDTKRWGEERRESGELQRKRNKDTKRKKREKKVEDFVQREMLVPKEAIVGTMAEEPGLLGSLVHCEFIVSLDLIWFMKS